jgi:two-component system sensor histidine kinase DegS
MNAEKSKKFTLTEFLKLASILYAVFQLPAVSGRLSLAIVFLVILTAFLIASIWNEMLKRIQVFILFEVACAFAAVLLTGYLKSPFMPVLLTTFLSASIYSNLVMTSISGILIVLIANLHVFQEARNLLLPANFLAFAIFSLGILNNYTSRPNKSDEKELPIEPSGYEGELERIRDLIEFQKKIKNSPSFRDLYSTFLDFIYEIGFSEFLIYFNQTETFYMSYISSGDVQVRDITKDIDFEPRNPPEIVFYNSKEFQKISSLPEITVYLPEKDLEDLDYTTLKLASDLFAHRAAELYLSEAEKQLLSRLSTLYDTSRQITKEIELLPLMETAAEAVKKMTGMQKSIICLCDKPEKIEEYFYDKNSTIIKGILTEHPEKIWASGFFRAASDALTNRKPVLATFSEFSLNLLCVPIVFQNRTFGIVAGITSLPREEAKKDLKTMEVIAALLGSAKANTELLKRRESVIINLERDRIAKDMHDNLIQPLFSMLLMIEVASKKIKDDPDKATEILQELRERMQQSIQEARETIISLYPKSLSEEGLLSALENLISEMRNTERNLKLEADSLPSSIPIEVENAILRIVQEACSNAIRHGNAKNIIVKIGSDSEKIFLSITDDGSGFDVSEIKKHLSPSEHMGITSIMSRVKSLGGEIDIESVPSKGTQVRVILPVNQEKD